MKYRIHRRTFLRGAAGALLPLPWLNLMEASVKTRSQASPPLRFMTLFKPNGVHPPSWNINGGSEFDFRMSPLMKPFEKHRDDLLILDSMGDFGFSSHASSTRRFLSGHHENKASASIDQLIADQIGNETPHRSLELTTEGLFPSQIGCSYISYDHKGQPIPRESDPQLVFDRLFRNPMQHPEKRRHMSSLLDRVREDTNALNRHTGYEDKQVLDSYLTVVRETEKRLENLENSAISAVEVSDSQRPPRALNLNEQVESMIDLISLALWTDSTRCISYMLGNSNSRMIFDFLGIKEQHHYLSHFFRNFSRSNIDALLKISLWHMEKFDYLLNRLKSYQDQHGSLLDHTMVIFGSGMGHSDNHTVKRIPMILAGGKGRIKTGRYVRYAENQELGRLHLALMQLFGVSPSEYAGAQTPLPGLDDSSYEAYQEQPFQSWVKSDVNSVIVQGRLRLSEDLNEARIFYMDVDRHPSIRIDVSFRDFHHFNLAYHCGTPITLSGKAEERDGRTTITKIKSLQSLYGKMPDSLNG